MEKQKSKTPGAVFLGIDAADTDSRGRAFVERYKWTWPSIKDPRRTQALRFGADYQPAFIVVDAKGRFVGGFQGRGTAARWDAVVAKLP